MKLTFVGCGDAFGSGGRFNTCFHVAATGTNFLIDCGASSLIAMKRLGIDRNAIDTILITHFHGDHFGGVPFFVLDAQFFSKRTKPLTIVGPEGLQAAYERTVEATFEGASKTRQKFDIDFIEISPDAPQRVGDIAVTCARVRHGPVDGPFLAYRIEVENRTIAYTGDTEWVDELVAIGRDADLFIAESYFFDKRVPLHLDLKTLEEKLPLIKPRRVILTHMNDDMLNKLSEIQHETASDGLVVEL
ncbi:MAG: MBL fold metallo-hydrolase [Hyphomicrobiaceae bacterium]|nr:MBL fold metallo-hydrolase [Hyphomicrobiaceae bacterium]MCC0011115.1 MBL fold metallo-hydrolase [Hyphomicrobiaceae bacterium]